MSRLGEGTTLLAHVIDMHVSAGFSAVDLLQQNRQQILVSSKLETMNMCFCCMPAGPLYNEPLNLCYVRLVCHHEKHKFSYLLVG